MEAISKIINANPTICDRILQGINKGKMLPIGKESMACYLVFSPSSFYSLFAQRHNLLWPSFYRMLMDALRFRAEPLALKRRVISNQTMP